MCSGCRAPMFCDLCFVTMGVCCCFHLEGPRLLVWRGGSVMDVIPSLSGGRGLWFVVDLRLEGWSRKTLQRFLSVCK